MNRQKIITALYIVLGIVLLGVGFSAINYGQITVTVQPQETISVDGTTVNKTTIKVRPGKHIITVQSPIKQTFSTQVSVLPFSKKTIAPVTLGRDFNTTIAAALGVDSRLVRAVDAGKLVDRVWFAAAISLPDEGQYVVLRYLDNHWVKAYVGTTKPSTANLPKSVTDYLDGVTL